MLLVYLLVVVLPGEALGRHPEGRADLREDLCPVAGRARRQPEVGQDGREAARPVAAPHQHVLRGQVAVDVALEESEGGVLI